ncbi:uberolysin/carnocyclin family circular bacteriocin [Ligilactobacillus sp. Marseille-Q7487]|uniref:uberolysin/carnocyclin family circular bacteriocin n=1 Tax=Ligilactobacillus sp. Marseille-Q7487 TaxID=3022128 RepID=UPI0024A7C5F4|nr:uberolysin/carnocyclin family circular bacteriocin [Ligilactobacillus sp. Marseille-Q7487]
MIKFSFLHSYLTSTLGISQHIAKKIIDIISGVSNIAAVVGIIVAIVGGGDVGVAIVSTAKAIAKKYGKVYAVAW